MTIAFGINVSLVEHNGFATSWSGDSAFKTKSMEVYEPVKAFLQEAFAVPGLFRNPGATTDAMVALVGVTNPPLRLLLGANAYSTVKAVYKERLYSFEEWETVSINAHINKL